MKIYLTVLLLVLAGCGTLSQPIQQTNEALEQRLSQLEDVTVRLKSEAIAESKDAAAELIDEATEKLEGSGKEVISHAASELDHKLEERLNQVDEMLEERISQAVAEVESAIDKQRESAKDDVKELMREEVPLMVEQSVIRSADKVAERLGAVKRTVPGPDGVPVEVWGLAGSGLLAGAWQLVRNMMNARAGKRRWSQDEFDQEVERKVAKILERRDYGSPGNRSFPRRPGRDVGPSFSWELSE